MGGARGIGGRECGGCSAERVWGVWRVVVGIVGMRIVVAVFVEIMMIVFVVLVSLFVVTIALNAVAMTPTATPGASETPFLG